LTFDRNVRGALTGGWQVDPHASGEPILTGRVVCEFKYRGNLPALFKEIMEAMRLTPRPVSKYRTFIAAAAPLLAPVLGARTVPRSSADA
jgi:hypothetical protein